MTGPATGASPVNQEQIFEATQTLVVTAPFLQLSELLGRACIHTKNASGAGISISGEMIVADSNGQKTVVRVDYSFQATVQGKVS